MGYVVMCRERVRALREEKGMSKRALAEKAGISVSTAKRVEREVPVTFRTGRAVAGALGVGPSRDLGRVLRRDDHGRGYPNREPRPTDREER
jgi:transcriptional regulator with XRE-family HTH domain